MIYGGALKSIPAEKWHINKGARMVNFAGFNMPVKYTSIIEEHLAVRHAVGFFDVSHMGQIRVRGLDAARWLNYMTSNDISNLNPGKAQYSLLLNESGGVVDDIIVYMNSIDDFLLVVNAANIEKDFSWLKHHAEGAVDVIDESNNFGLVAVSGPLSRQVITRIFNPEEVPSNPFRFRDIRLGNHNVTVSTTGYTGEESYEIFLPADQSEYFLDLLMEAGSEAGIRPCGLGARDSLRIEACLPLYGNELNETTTPFESSLDWVVKMKKSDFIGRSALENHRLERKLGFFVALSAGPIPRTGCEVIDVTGEKVGSVSSGTYSPILERPVFMAFVKPPLYEPGRRVKVKVRDRVIDALAVNRPFHKLSKEVLS